MSLRDYLSNELSHNVRPKVPIVPISSIHRLVDESLRTLDIAVREKAFRQSVYSNTTVTTVKELITNL